MSLYRCFKCFNFRRIIVGLQMVLPYQLYNVFFNEIVFDKHSNAFFVLALKYKYQFLRMKSVALDLRGRVNAVVAWCQTCTHFAFFCFSSAFLYLSSQEVKKSSANYIQIINSIDIDYV